MGIAKGIDPSQRSLITVETFSNGRFSMCLVLTVSPVYTHFDIEENTVGKHCGKR